MKFDMIIFGASGYTGQFVTEYLARAVEREAQGWTWAVSGRSESKLRAVLKQASLATGLALEATPIVVCDTADAESLASMARQARLVLNCAGPYRFLGEPVVRACVEAGTHHVDISGEPQYMEKMQLQYHAQAEAQGIYVVSACGFDSIPADLGQMFLTERMEGDVHEIETFLRVTTPPNVPGPAINFGTWQSAIYGLAMAHELKPLRRQLFPEPLPSTKPRLARRGVVHFHEPLQSWCLPFPGSDRSVMMRTQRARYHRDGQRPAQIGCYVQTPSLFYAGLTIVVGLFFGLLAKFAWGRACLEAYPGFFSAGLVTKQGPSAAMTQDTNFELTLVGRGWRQPATGHTIPSETPPNRQVTVTVKGRNIGYGATCECLVQAALVILLEKDRMPGPGGVFPPGYAFARTSLVERLDRNQVEFRAQTQELTVE